MIKKKKVLILIQSGYSARNFVLSGFLNNKDFEFVFWSDQDYLSQYNLKSKTLKLPESDYQWKVNFIQKIKNKAELFYNVKRTGNKNYLSYLTSIYQKRALKSNLKDKLSSIIASLYANRQGIEKLDKPFYKNIRKSNYYKQCLEQLKEQQPDLVFCTHQRASGAVAPMLAVKDMAIDSVCFIHSWDNIPKGVQLVKSDHYFVWSDYMKAEMLEHYPFIDKDNIHVTGTPQFTFYRDDQYKVTREDFCNDFSLDTSQKFILFSGNDKTTSPNDPEYLKHICDAVKSLNKDKSIYHILFRPNPIDRNEGFDAVLKENEKVVTEIKPDWFGAKTFLWNQGGPNVKDISLLINTIYHSDLIINMGSTMALDAAILGKPSCYIKYDVPSNYNWSVFRTYEFIHFKILKDIKPVFWINSKEEMKSVIKTALLNPEETKEGREEWIDRVTKRPIKKTNERIWNILKTISDEV